MLGRGIIIIRAIFSYDFGARLSFLKIPDSLSSASSTLSLYLSKGCSGTLLFRSLIRSFYSLTLHVYLQFRIFLGCN